MELIIKEHTILIDDEDFEKLSQYTWYIQRIPTKHREYKYVRYTADIDGIKNPSMHQILLGFPEKPAVIHHIDGDGLNNKRENLEIFKNNRENLLRRRNIKYNKSGYRGVYWDKEHKKWRADIRVNNKGMFLGRFDNPHEAGEVYKKAKMVYHKVSVS